MLFVQYEGLIDLSLFKSDSTGMIRAILLLSVVLMLFGCSKLHTAHPLSNNVWQMETGEYGSIGTATVDDATLVKAAKLTIQQGYFKFFVHTKTTDEHDLTAWSKNKSVIVIMFLASDPQAEKALDARFILESKRRDEQQ